MGRREMPAMMIGLVVSVAVVAIGDRCGSGVIVEENAASAPEAPAETQSLHELVRGVSNYGFETGAPGSQNVVYWGHVFEELEAEDLEYRALLDSLSPGVRASYDGLWMLRREAFKRERERQASEPVPVGTTAENRWNKIYRSVLSTPQSMIGGFAATDAALDEFVGRARPVPPDVSAAWKTVLRLKSEAWDVQACVRYQRAQFVICEHERAKNCKERLERALSECDACSNEGACGGR